MPRSTALRNSALCCVAVVSVAACGTIRASSSAAPRAGHLGDRRCHRSHIGRRSTRGAGCDANTSGIDQQISAIDNQLSAIDGQLNAASAGLSNSEGDPSQ